MSEVVVTVTPEYLRAQSNPDKGQYSFAYHIRIENHGDQAAQLISRHWIITDGNAHVKEVQGAGVVGEQPMIAPGQSHQYSRVGTMEGSYQMVDDSGEEFDVPIPTFLLSVPGAIH